MRPASWATCAPSSCSSKHKLKLLFHCPSPPPGDQKKRAARIVGNLCTLVNDPRDMQPYVPLLLPELKVGAGACAVDYCS